MATCQPLRTVATCQPFARLARQLTSPPFRSARKGWHVDRRREKVGTSIKGWHVILTLACFILIKRFPKIFPGRRADHVECCSSTCFSLISMWIAGGGEGDSRATSLQNETNGRNRSAQPKKVGTSCKGWHVARAVPKGGDVSFQEKGWHVATGGHVKTHRKR